MPKKGSAISLSKGHYSFPEEGFHENYVVLKKIRKSKSFWNSGQNVTDFSNIYIYVFSKGRKKSHQKRL